MSNFDLAIENRLIISKIIRVVGYSIAFLYFYKKTNNLATFITLFAVGMLGSEIIAFVEYISINGFSQFAISNFFLKGSRNSGTFLLVFIFVSFFNKYKVAHLFYGLVSAVIGNSITKFDCFIKGDLCYGLETKCITGMQIKGLNPSIVNVHPVPLYDSLFFMALAIVLISFEKKIEMWKLLVFGFISISIYGFFIELIRVNPEILSIFTINQIAYFMLFFLSVVEIAMGNIKKVNPT
ncbi:MAG: prolipoprotein diacylglyceryl transferase [Chitinophagales bacterium]